MKDPLTFEHKFAERLASIERRLEAAEGTRTLRSAAIDEPGVLQVKTALGTVTAFIGRLADGMMGFIFRRQNGVAAMTLQQNAQDTSTQFWALWDRSGNIVVSDDATSGQGLATPWLPIPMYSCDYTTWAGTDSTTFVKMYETPFGYKQQPRMYVRARATSDESTTTGEIRLMVDGVQIGTTQTVSFALAYYDFGPLAVAGAHRTAMQVQIECRVTAGPGKIRATAVGAAGRGS